jgi:hypothetical protein
VGADVPRGSGAADRQSSLAGKELIVARNDVRQTRAPLHQLGRIAGERRAPLVLVPHLTGLDAGRLDDCAEAAEVPVHAILGALRR